MLAIGRAADRLDRSAWTSGEDGDLAILRLDDGLCRIVFLLEAVELGIWDLAVGAQRSILINHVEGGEFRVDRLLAGHGALRMSLLRSSAAEKSRSWPARAFFITGRGPMPALTTSLKWPWGRRFT